MEVSVNTLVEDLLRPRLPAAIAACAGQPDADGAPRRGQRHPLEGEFLRSADVVNTMIQQLGVFTAEVTRVAREVGTDGKLGGHSESGVAGTWKDLTDSVNSMASNLTGQVRNIAEVATAVGTARARLRWTCAEKFCTQRSHQHDGRSASVIRFEVTRVAREVGTDGKLGGQAVVPGVAGT